MARLFAPRPTTFVNKLAHHSCYIRAGVVIWVIERGGAQCPFVRFLDGEGYDPELVQAMGSALERACAKLGLTCAPKDASAELIAAKIISLAATGIHDTDALYQSVMTELGAPP